MDTVNAYEIIENAFEEDIADIMKSYSKTQLTDIFIYLYGFKPMSNQNKKSIIQSILSHFYSRRRLLSFNHI